MMKGLDRFNLSSEELDEIIGLAQSYQITSGMTLGIKIPNNGKNIGMQVAPLPTTLFPSRIPRDAFDSTRALMPLMNLLRDKVSRDFYFIEKHLSEAATVDQFVRNLLNIYRIVHEEGILQPIYLGLHRSDYMLHFDENTGKYVPQQVEINMISAGFGGMSSKASKLHEFLLRRYPKLQKLVDSYGSQGQLEISESAIEMPKAMAAAHNAFGTRGDFILFLCQPNERNLFDQKLLEHALWENHGIPVIRMTLKEVHDYCGLSQDSNQDLIIVNNPGDRYLIPQKIGHYIASVIYFRSCYTPKDFQTEEDWNTRLMIERSSVIKCPSIAYQLCGLKKIQQILTDPKVLMQYVSEHESKLLLPFFTGIWTLDKKDIVEDALRNPDGYVVKPQREGGGNLIFGNQLKTLLMNMTDNDVKEYIIMKRIQPKAEDSIIIRDGNVEIGKCISELGIYGAYLGDGKQTLLNKCCGYLLRSKGESVEDGGVASGIASMDSCYTFLPQNSQTLSKF